MKWAMKKWVIAALIVSSIGCSSSFSTNAYKSLASLRAAYLIEEPIREVACKGKVPQPPACVSAFNAAQTGYTVLVEGSELLAVYVETKTDETKARIIRLLPVILDAAVSLTRAAEGLK